MKIHVNGNDGNWERCQALKFDNLVDLFYFVDLVDLVGLVDFVYHYARKVRNEKLFEDRSSMFNV